MVALFVLGILCVVGYLALRGVRALEIDQGKPAHLESLAEEIELLREQHQHLGSQLNALREGQEFARQLSASNPGQRDAPSVPRSTP